jgi:hypothetical protein
LASIENHPRWDDDDDDAIVVLLGEEWGVVVVVVGVAFANDPPTVVVVRRGRRPADENGRAAGVGTASTIDRRRPITLRGDDEDVENNLAIISPYRPIAGWRNK